MLVENLFNFRYYNSSFDFDGFFAFFCNFFISVNKTNLKRYQMRHRQSHPTSILSITMIWQDFCFAFFYVWHIFIKDQDIHRLFQNSLLHVNTVFEKSNFCPKIQFWQDPTTFSRVFHQIFLTIFLVKSKLSTAVQNFNIFMSFSPILFVTFFLVKWKLSLAKNSKTTTFSRVFHPKKNPTIFSGNQSWILGQKLKISNNVNETQGGIFKHCLVASRIIRSLYGTSPSIRGLR